MGREWEPGSVADLVGDGVTREILRLTSDGERSAEALIERCDASGPTVYRRLDALGEYDLLAESVAYDEDGNHYRTYECRLREVCIAVDDGSLSVDVRVGEES